MHDFRQVRTATSAVALAVALAVAGLSLAGAAPAHAEQTPGFYIGGGVGFSMLATQATTLDVLMGISPATRVGSSKAAFDGGFGMVTSAGYAVGNGLRYEIEADLRENGQSRSAPGPGGTETRFGLFANALYDADLGVRWVTPYLGVGIGFEVARWSSVIVNGATDPSQGDPLRANVAGSGSNLAYQVIAGLAFPVDQVTGLSVTAEYRYTALTGSRGYNGAASSISAGPFPAHVRTQSESAHSFLVGLRYAFDAVPFDDDAMLSLPPAIPMRPAASRTYIVYFDAGSAILGPRARDVLAEAARASGRIQFTRIEVSGHTDRSGTTQGNVELSKARSDAVAEEMVRWGILRTAIDIHAFGEERPAVKTAAGVREARNRRVEIVYR